MNDWITEQELETAKGMASEIFAKFCKDKQGCESDWVEIEVGGKFFDVECHDETGADTGNYRKGTMYCAIYPVYPTEYGTWTETDGSKWIRLFTNKEQTND